MVSTVSFQHPGYPLTCNAEPVPCLQRNAGHLFSHHIIPSDYLSLHFNQLANLSLPCLSFDQLNHQETLKLLLTQGFSEISLNRGQIWSENLKQENRGHSSSESINHHELSQATPTGLGFPCQRWVTDKLPKARREQKDWPKAARGWAFSKKQRKPCKRMPLDGWWSLISIPGSHEQQEIKTKIDQNSLCWLLPCISWQVDSDVWSQ